MSSPPAQLNNDQIDLIKRTIAKGATDDEFALFIWQCQRTRLDPFSNQICMVKRWDSTLKRNVMSVQVQIAGLQLIADRTGNYAPGKAPTFETDKDGHLISATAYVKKYAQGIWHKLSATAFYAEAVQYTKEREPVRSWAKMPRLMTAKCAEAMALRRAFPGETSGLYTQEEMGGNRVLDDGEVVENLPSPVEHNDTALPPPRANGPQMPKTGVELLERMKVRDTAECVAKLIQPGDLVEYIRQRGMELGYSDNISDWDDESQIKFAIEETKEFLNRKRDGRISTAQEDAIYAMCRERDYDIDRLCVDYEIGVLADMTQTHYRDVVTKLKDMPIKPVTPSSK